MSTSATPKHWRMVDPGTGETLNRIVWDGDKTVWQPPEGVVVVLEDADPPGGYSLEQLLEVESLLAGLPTNVR